MASLYELVEQDREIRDMLSDPDADEDLITGTLECIKAELEVKAESYVKIIRQLEADQKANEHEAKFFEKRASVIKDNIKRMKDALCAAMIATGHDDKNGLDAGSFKLKVSGNGGVQPLVINGEVPDSYTKIIYENDTEKIRKALESGEKLSFAHLEPRGKHLSIK